MTENDGRRQKIKELYRYNEMSNKVLAADKRLLDNNGDPIKDAEESQPKSMKGRISVKDMGSKICHDLSPEEKDEIQKEIASKLQKRSPKYPPQSTTILDSSYPLKYYPSDTENTQIYEEILVWVSDLLGSDMPHDVIVETADLLIAALKNSEKDRDGRIDRLRENLQNDLGIEVTELKFQELLKLTKQITDYESKSITDQQKAVAILSEEPYEAEGEESVIETEGGEEDGIEAEEEKTHHVDREVATQGTDETLIIQGVKDNPVVKVAIQDVDEFFLRRVLANAIKNAEPTDIQKLADTIFIELEKQQDRKKLEGQLMKLLDFENLFLVDFFLRERNALVWGIRLARVPETSKEELLKQMCDQGLDELVNQYRQRGKLHLKRQHPDELEGPDEDLNRSKRFDGENKIPPLVDLDSIKFDRTSRLLTVTKIQLPEGSYKKLAPHYEEIHIPAPEKKDVDFDPISISAFPQWAKNAFSSGETDTLNLIQSKLYPVTFQQDENVLLCAPTGAGKTNVAMMAILRVISHHINPNTNKLLRKNFKAIYIAPLKALVQEQVLEFQRRLAYLGIKVAELTGDSHLSRQQLLEAQVLISTPEKWDVITRKADESSFVQFVQLIIIDEIHLLHDARGPVLESIVARSLQGKTFQQPPRLVALSATLPNYQDVARFLRVPDTGLFYFDSSFRPCPLSQQYCAITEKASLKKLNAMNEACFEKTLQSVKDGHQVIIFVHSRKETGRTALWLREKFFESDNIDLIRKSDTASRKILDTESENVHDGHLKRILQVGIGIHHAGLSKSDRSLSEDLFADGLVQVLVSTATLAWGVNLPAHTVIIKGTDVYSPESGTWEQLSPQDLLQMLGRAGRPRYDTSGEGIIITDQSNVQFYLAVLNQQLPIESQFVSMMVDNLNAEVVAGNIQNRQEGVEWLTYTYLYIRMLMSPELYKVPKKDGDDNLSTYRQSLIHSALAILHEENLVVYEAENGKVEPTELGKIASYFYIKHNSMQVYDSQITQHSNQIDLLRIIALSDEFKHIAVRQEERQELRELLERVPIPIREDSGDALAKVNVLLQSYISHLKFDGFALNADMIFITQNAGRLFSAIYELCLKKNWSNVTKILLNFRKAVERRMWVANSPLRQFKSCPSEVIKRTEASTLPWNFYLDLQSPAEVGQSIRSEKHGKLVYDLLRRFPRLSLKCAIQPITPSLLKFELEVLPEWIWDNKWHDNIESFIVILEDTDGEQILYSDVLLIKKEYIGLEHFMDIYLTLNPSQQRNLPPNFFVTVISEKWCHSGSQIAIGLEPIRLPKKFPAPTPLMDISLIPVTNLENADFSRTFYFKTFNKFQSQVFEPLYNSNENIFIGATKGSGKTVMAELALLHHWSYSGGRAVYISPHGVKIDQLLNNWNNRFSGVAGGKVIRKLGSDMNLNFRIIAQSHLILATPEQFELVSRRWRQRKNIQRIELVIYDDIHEISRGMFGAVYETLISRMTFISTQLEKTTRIVALGSCLANGRDLGDWIGAPRNNIFNFSPQERPNALEIHLHTFEIMPSTALNIPMAKYTFKFATELQKQGVIVFLPSRRTCLTASSTFIQYAQEANWNMAKTETADLCSHLTAVDDKELKRSLTYGIGLIYEEMTSGDREITQKLFECGAISILIVSKDCCYDCPAANAVVVLGTQYYEGKEHRFVDYSANEILEMVGSAQSDGIDGMAKSLILTSPKMKEYYKKFLAEALPIESFMYFHLNDALSSEISTAVIQSKQDCVDWIAYTYFFRRIHANPSFYGVKDVSPHGISAYLTELVENALSELQRCDFIELHETDQDEIVQEEVISPLNACLISAHHNVSFLTMYMLLNSLSGSSTLREMLQSLSKASEFEGIALRQEDESILLKLNKQMPIKLTPSSGGSPVSYKVFLLLQAYFSRFPLSKELQFDLRIILRKAIPLINAIIDILSSDGLLNATTGMDISQMLVQGVWDTENPLKQIPFFDGSILEKCKEKGVETVYDVMALDDDERQDIMTMENHKLTEVAQFINNFPNVELEYSLDLTVPLAVGTPKEINVTLTRDEVPETLEVTSENFPGDKLESWWIVIGEISSKQLYAIKKVSLNKEKQTYALEFAVEAPGKHQLTLWCVCDSYLDADKEVSFEVEVR
ncbi:probable Pre-mRNA-splicing helicase BRR2 [Zygosaccharomyces bailii]|nr:probable Pre-mRNA-splicing helicase BRR2 [Zygosaccharomyces bailii]